MIKITSKQFELLQGFMLHCWNVYHNGEKSMWDFWDEQMDTLGISWKVQNTASYLMSKRENGFYYFSNLLKREGIEVIR